MSSQPLLPGGYKIEQWLVSLACLLIYLVSAPVEITFEDAGMLSILCDAGKPVHPPGYPLYSIGCAMAANIPWLNTFNGLSLLSMLSVSASVWLLYGLLVAVVSRKAATAGAFAYGTSLAVWSQAIIPEVYGPNLLVFMLLLVSAVRFSGQSTPSRALILSLCAGLALAIHWPLVLLGGVAVFVYSVNPVLKLFRNHGVVNALGSLAAGLLLGLTPYAWMFIQLGAEGFSFLGPLSEPSEWVGYVFREIYQEQDHNPNADFQDKLAYLPWLTVEAARQLGWFCLPVILAGLWRAWHVLSATFYWMLWLLLLSQTLILSLLLNFEFDYFHRSIFQPYPLIGYLALAAWFAIGLDYIGKQLNPGTRSAFLLLLAISVPLSNLQANNRHFDRAASEFGRLLLESVPRNGVLFVHGDFDTGAAGYLHYLENFRPDIELRHDGGLIFANRLFNPEERWHDKKKIFLRYLSETDRSVFTTTLFSELPAGSYLKQRGLLWELKRGVPEVAGCEPVRSHLDFALKWAGYQGELHPHVRRFVNMIVVGMTQCLLKAPLGSFPEESLQDLALHPMGALVMLENLMAQPLTGENRKLINLLALQVESYLGYMVKEYQASAHLQLAQVRMRASPAGKMNFRAVENHLLQSINLLRLSEHPARLVLYDLYRTNNEILKAEALIRQFPADPALSAYVAGYSRTNVKQEQRHE